MTAFLRSLVLLLAVSVWSQVFPSVPKDGSERASQSGRGEWSSTDCEGLPCTPQAPVVRRTLSDPQARAVEPSHRHFPWPAGGADGAKVEPRRLGSLLLDCVARVAPEFQAHLRTNGSADAHGSRA